MQKLGSLFEIVVLTLASSLLLYVYIPSFSGPFLLDDMGNIANAAIESLSIDNLMRALTGNTAGLFGRPIPALTFAINFLFFGDNPYWYKVCNWCLHVIIAALMYKLTTQLQRAVDGEQRWHVHGAYDYQKVFALLIVLIWALHPLQVSTVAYVVQRMAQLSTLFTVLTLIVYLSGRKTIAKTGAGTAKTILLVCMFGILGCLSKENAVLIPVYILVIEAVVFRFRFDSTVYLSKYRLLVIFCCISPICIALLILAFKYKSLLSGYSFGSLEFSLTERLYTECVVVIGYLLNIVLPSIDNMNLYQDSWEIQRSLSVSVAGSLLFHCSMLCIAISVRKKLTFVSVGILLFYASHVLESTVLPLAVAFEHRNYFGLFGVSLAVVSFLNWMFEGFRKNGLQLSGLFHAGTAAIIVASISLQTFARSVEWSDELVFHAMAVENFPESFSSRSWYAVSLMKTGETESAIEQLNYASAVKPESAYPEMALLHFKCIAGSSLGNEYRDALEELSSQVIDVTVLSALLNLSSSVKSGVCSQLDSDQIGRMLEVVYFNNNHSLPSRLRSIVAFEYTSYLLEIGNIEKATKIVEPMLQKSKRNPIALIQSGRIHVRLGDRAGLEKVLLELNKLNRSDKHSYALQVDQLKLQLSELAW